jgi:hypothetical protein
MASGLLPKEPRSASMASIGNAAICPETNCQSTADIVGCKGHLTFDFDLFHQVSSMTASNEPLQWEKNYSPPRYLWHSQQLWTCPLACQHEGQHCIKPAHLEATMFRASNKPSSEKLHSIEIAENRRPASGKDAVLRL